jgi:hypothetical protein
MTMSPDVVRSLIDTLPTDLLIDGEWIGTADRFPVENPATGEVIAQVANATPEHGMQALAAADAALPGWAATDPRVRSEILRRAFELIVARTDELAILITAYRSTFARPQRSPTQPAAYSQIESIFPAGISNSKHNTRPDQRILSPLPLPIGLWGRRSSELL